MPSIHVHLCNAVKLKSYSPPGAPVTGPGEEWWKKHHKGKSSSTTGGASNSTKIKEREAHEYVYHSNHLEVVKFMANREPGTFPGHPEHHSDGWPSSSSGAGNSTKIKERQGGPPGGMPEGGPPNEMTYASPLWYQFKENLANVKQLDGIHEVQAQEGF